MSSLLERSVHAVAEDVVVLKQLFAKFLRATSWRFRQAGRRVPRSSGRAASFSSFRAALLGAAPSSGHRPPRRRCPNRRGVSPSAGAMLAKFGEEVVAELVVERRRGGLRRRRRSAAISMALTRELAVQAERALDGDLPVAEGGIGEIFDCGFP
jgi:hypothetical protein